MVNYTQSFEKRVSDNVSLNLTPYKFHASTGLQFLFPTTEIAIERRWSAQAFVSTNSSSKLRRRLIVKHAFWQYNRNETKHPSRRNWLTKQTSLSVNRACNNIYQGRNARNCGFLSATAINHANIGDCNSYRL